MGKIAGTITVNFLITKSLSLQIDKRLIALREKGETKTKKQLIVELIKAGLNEQKH